MRILKLPAAVEKNLLRARHERDRQAERIAARIMSQQLAHLTEDSPATTKPQEKDKAELARLLDVLLQK